MSILPYGRQSIDVQDIKAVVRILKGDWLTQGPTVDAFEKKLAAVCGAKFAVAVSSATAGLHLCHLVLDLQANDEVITSPVTFLATSNAVLYAGARPVFADVDPRTINLDPSAVKNMLSRKTKAIVPVHFAGRPCDMPALRKIAKENGLKVVEDASHALGAQYKSGQEWFKVGSCRHSDMAVFSFHPVKIITSGEGGAVTTNDEQTYLRLKALRSHGMYKDSSTEKHGPWYYEMRELGFNYRITDIQCALGLSQLMKLPRFIRRRQKISETYGKAFKALPNLKILEPDETTKNAHHLFVVRLNFEKIGKNRKEIMEALRSEGVGTQVHYIPVYQQPFYKRLGYAAGQCPNAEAYYREALSLPLFPDMKDSDVKKVISAVKKILK